nr:uncharacterized protein CTRU02_08629 [Colletotrichum truncatum]KAF6789930.1 hypothetical protein CTRU02_08629 [Colletotrichum truncatum]
MERPNEEEETGRLRIVFVTQTRDVDNAEATSAKVGKWHSGGTIETRIRKTSATMAATEMTTPKPSTTSTLEDMTTFFTTEAKATSTVASSSQYNSTTRSETSGAPSPDGSYIVIKTTTLIAVIGGIVGGFILLCIIVGMVSAFLRRKQAEEEDSNDLDGRQGQNTQLPQFSPIYGQFAPSQDDSSFPFDNDGNHPRSQEWHQMRRIAAQLPAESGVDVIPV